MRHIAKAIIAVGFGYLSCGYDNLFFGFIAIFAALDLV